MPYEIKPLEWEDSERYPYDNEDLFDEDGELKCIPCIEAATIDGEYLITSPTEGVFHLEWRPDDYVPIKQGEHDSEDEAKKEAQRRHDKAVRSFVDYWTSNTGD